MEIALIDRQRTHKIPRRELRSFLSQLVAQVPPRAADSVAVCLVSDRRMRELNRRFRGQSGTTDVLSFDSDDPGMPPGESHLGDIVISVTTAARQACEAGHSLEHELKILALHGYLHLLGYDHEVDDGTMLRLQSELSRRLGVDAAEAAS